MSTRPIDLSLDRMDTSDLRDLQAARAWLLPREQHALMSAWGGPPQVRACYIVGTPTATSAVVGVSVPPGVTEMRVIFEAVTDDREATVGFTTSVDATGTEFNLVGVDMADPSMAVRYATGGVLDSSEGAHTGRALTVLAAAAWEYTDVDVTITFSVTTSKEVRIVALGFEPIHVPR